MSLDPEDLKKLSPRQLQELHGRIDMATRSAQSYIPHFQKWLDRAQTLARTAQQRLAHFERLPLNDPQRDANLIQELRDKVARRNEVVNWARARLDGAVASGDTATGNRQALQYVDQWRGVGRSAGDVVTTSQKAGQSLGDRLMSMAQRVGNKAADLAGKVLDWGKEKKDKAIEFVRPAWSRAVSLWNAGWRIVQNNWQRITTGIGAVVTALRNGGAALLRGAFHGGTKAGWVGALIGVAVVGVGIIGGLAWSSGGSPDPPPQEPGVPGPQEPGPKEPPPGDEQQNPPPGNEQENPPPGDEQQNPPPGDEQQNPPPGDEQQNPPPGDQPENEPQPSEPAPQQPHQEQPQQPQQEQPQQPQHVPQGQ